ncbi:molybdate ABC transporter substrate-binding protein [Acidaminococcus sp. LBK-2]|uniref:molybdate ABC transporter substrate-binding protein n=1 Tax=Acidaminococcus sp. LBK-2 TaxID=3456956 RepID=UPI003FA4CAF8
MKKALAGLLGSLAVFLIFGCGNSAPQPKAAQEEIYISAAASMADAVNEIKGEYEKKHPEVAIRTNYAGSGTLMNQIMEGSPADLFISASDKQMDTLEKKQLVDGSSRVELLKNELVLIVPKASSLALSSFQDAAGDNVTKIAIADPASVPVGQYSEKLFQNMGIWDQVKQKMVLSQDVRQSLEWVASGNVPCAPVYRTDAAIEKDRVRIVAVAPGGINQGIFYPLAILKKSGEKPAVRDFYQYLKSPEAQKVYEKYGFVVNVQ